MIKRRKRAVDLEMLKHTNNAFTISREGEFKASKDTEFHFGRFNLKVIIKKKQQQVQDEKRSVRRVT